MRARVVTDAIVGGGFFLRFGDQVELEAFGEYAEAMVQSCAIELTDPIVYAEQVLPVSGVELH